ncbi:MAG: TfoX/Sxy family protein [Ruminococcus sp.]|nr:TfoX/Sxy family protein [Ruminococcus sp.]
MASSKGYLDFVLDQLSELDGITYRSMMGEYILYYRGKIIGGIYDNRLLLKPTKAVSRVFPDAVEALPYDGAKPMLMPAQIEDSELLTKAVTEMYDELPEPKKKNNSLKRKA